MRTVKINESFTVPLKWLLVVIFTWPGTIALSLIYGSGWVHAQIDSSMAAHNAIVIEKEAKVISQIQAVNDSVNKVDKKLDQMMQLLIEEIRKNGNVAREGR